MSIPEINFKNIHVLHESEGVMCESDIGFLGGGVDSCLSEFSCILRFNSDPSVSEMIVRVFEIEDVFMLSHLKDLAHSFGLK